MEQLKHEGIGFKFNYNDEVRASGFIFQVCCESVAIIRSLPARLLYAHKRNRTETFIIH